MPHKQFFAYRNGMLADAIRQAGCPCARIFGLNVPQLAQIARQYGHNDELAHRLWAEKECRESRLLACYLFDPDKVSKQKALDLIDDIQSIEEADMLAFRLLKRLPTAEAILAAISDGRYPDGSLGAYEAKILTRHLEA